MGSMQFEGTGSVVNVRSFVCRNVLASEISMVRNLPPPFPPFSERTGAKGRAPLE